MEKAGKLGLVSQPRPRGKGVRSREGQTEWSGVREEEGWGGV